MPAHEAEVDILVVDVDERPCGLRSDDLVEMHQAVALTPLPEAPAVVEGVIDVRGQVLAVLDLRKRLGRPTRPVRPSDHLVIVDTPARRLALRVDRVERLVTVPAAQLEPIERIAPEAGYLAGVARLPDGIVVVYDLPSFLSADEAEALGAAMARWERERDSR